MDRTILITGANGSISSTTIPLLRQQGVEVRAVVRDLTKSRPLLELGCKVVLQDLDKPVPPSLFEGVDAALFLTAASPNAPKQMHNLIDAAEGSNVHVVRVSALKASVDAPTSNGRAHHRSEMELRSSGLPHTILRPNFHFQNILQALPSIQGDGKIRQGMGSARLGMIDARDTAACAATILLNGGHVNKTYTLTGPASIGWSDVAKTVSRVVGSKVQYVPVPLEPIWHDSLDFGLSEWSAQSAVDYAKAYSEGWGDLVTNDVRAITGKPPRSLSHFCDEVIGPLVQPAV